MATGPNCRATGSICGYINMGAIVPQPTAEFLALQAPYTAATQQFCELWLSIGILYVPPVSPSSTFRARPPQCLEFVLGLQQHCAARFWRRNGHHPARSGATAPMAER